MKELLMGCGSRTEKDIYIGNKDFENVTRLDINPDHNPDIVWDLTVHPLPFLAEEFDEIHAYQVLEHLAYQGDYEFFLRNGTSITESSNLMDCSLLLCHAVYGYGVTRHISESFSRKHWSF